MKEYKTADANTLVANVAYNFSELCGIYPITPASPMAESVDILSNQNKLNYFKNKVKIIEMESETGAIALVHGALQGGTLATTFTASQGLLLMIPTLYKLAGECLPAVIHVAARSLSTHALSILGDHQDIYATRSTGVCILASSSVEQAYHLSNVAHLSAISSSLPFIHFFDGFRTSHEINKVKLIDEIKIKKLLDVKALYNFRKNAINPSNPNTRGTNENDDIYFQHTESRNNLYNQCVNYVVNYLDKINELASTNYKPFNYFGCKEPTKIIIAMGSVCQTTKETVTYLNKYGHKVGMIEVHLYRPFSQEYLLKSIPKTVKKIAVLDRTKEPGSLGEPLYLDVCASLTGRNIEIIGGRYGLSSKNTTPAHINDVFNFLDNENNFTGFTIGITDDVTNLSIPHDDTFTIENNYQEYLFYGYGSDGMVGASKDILKIIGEYTTGFVQGYFKYDSKKSGGITISNIRLGKNPINSPYYIENPTFIVISKDSYLYKYDILDKIKDNGTVLLNTSLTPHNLAQSLPNKVKNIIAIKKLNLYIVDAYKVVNHLGLKNKIGTCLETCIFSLINIIDTDLAIKILKKHNEINFKHKGQKIVDINNKIIDETIKHLTKITINPSWTCLKPEKPKELSFNEIINSLKGDNLPVSAFIDKQNGIFAPGTSKLEKRKIAENVPLWIKDNCSECNQCSFVCPHGVIRPFLLEKDINGIETKNTKAKDKDLKYALGISYDDCTGCGLCANTCPGKQGKKALIMKPYDKEIFIQKRFDVLLKQNVNHQYQNEIVNVRNSQFITPKFEFSGACAGCGQTAYIKNLTQLFGNSLTIANATGCSSIYGATAPNTPYSIAWANSLFEDNAQYGLGILQANIIMRDKVKKLMISNIDKVDEKTKGLFNKWLKNKQDDKICKMVHDKLNYNKNAFLKPFKDYILTNSVWIIGGDGFAYDIGYGGLDHVLATNEDINILILDTEVYSNTGGQASKSSNIGSIASFTSNGKTTYKKDLAKIAMCYPQVYVAAVNIGYNKNHYLKALAEAKNHPGPSLIIAYAPCIEHGIIDGMETSLINSFLATKCGYFPTFRYNPDTKEFTLDSKDVDFNLYQDFLKSQTRYANLKNIDKSTAKELLAKNKEFAQCKYEYYKKLSS